MKLGALAKCPYCRNQEERDIDIHSVFTCSKCNKQYHAFLKIEIITLPLTGGNKDEV